MAKVHFIGAGQMTEAIIRASLSNGTLRADAISLERQALKPLRQIANPGHFKTSVVDKDGTTLTARTDQCFSKGF